MANNIPTVTFSSESLDVIVKGLAMDSVQQVIYDKLLPNIEVSINKNKKECVFCYVQEYQVIIPQKTYKVTLETLEKYYLLKEDYPKCLTIRDLLIKLEKND